MRRLLCLIGFHNWMRWRMLYPKMDIQQRKCRACPKRQRRVKPLSWGKGRHV